VNIGGPLANPFIPRSIVHRWSEEIGKNPDGQKPLVGEMLASQERLAKFLTENLTKLSPAARPMCQLLMDVTLLVFYLSEGEHKRASWDDIRASSGKVQMSVKDILPIDDGLPARMRTQSLRAQPHIIDEMLMLLFETDAGLSPEDSLRIFLLLWLLIEVLDRMWTPPKHFAGDRTYSHVTPADIAAPPQPGIDQPPPGIERSDDRFEHMVELSVHSEHNFYTGFTQNISSGGLFLATNLIRPIGSIIEFDLKLGSGRGQLPLKGEVRWVREPSEFTRDVPPGMGLKFIDLDPRVAAKMDQFITGKRDSIFYDDDDDDDDE
jgi:uncharacterized protein (TIGR02266 family)